MLRDGGLEEAQTYQLGELDMEFIVFHFRFCYFPFRKFLSISEQPVILKTSYPRIVIQCTSIGFRSSKFNYVCFARPLMLIVDIYGMSPFSFIAPRTCMLTCTPIEFFGVADDSTLVRYRLLTNVQKLNSLTLSSFVKFGHASKVS